MLTDLPHEPPDKCVDVVVLLLQVADDVARGERDLPQSLLSHHLSDVLNTQRVSDLVKTAVPENIE
jgi:hypothetical protein